MSFTPTQAGQHQVSVIIRGKHLQGSPFNLEVIDRPVKPYSRDYNQVGDKPASRFGSVVQVTGNLATLFFCGVQSERRDFCC